MRQLKIEKLLTVRETRGVMLYLQEVEKLPMITPEEEIKLAERIREGDQVALEKLVLANLRFVISVAKKYQYSKMSLLDLINEGNVGLIQTAKRFDEKKGFKFISYAVWWIRQSIMLAITEKGKPIRVPNNKAGVLNKMRNAQERFEQFNEREPTAEELADILSDKEISLSQIKEAFEINQSTLSLDRPMEEGGDFSLCDMLEYKGGNTVMEMIERESTQSTVGLLLAQLPERERFAVEGFFGIGRTPMTIDDMSDQLGLTRERVRQLKEKGVIRMRSLAYRNKKVLEMV